MLQLPENIEYINIVWPRLAFIIKKVCEHYKAGRVLDIGCGNGRITKMLGKLGIDLLGIDIDAQEIQKAVDSNEYANVQFACRSVQEMKEKDSGIILTEVLEHIEDPGNFLKAIALICENEGFLIVTIPNGYCLKEIIMAVIRHLKKITIFAKIITQYKNSIGRNTVFNESPHLQQFTLKKIQALLEEAGFTVKEEFYADIWSGLLWMYAPWIPVPFFVKKI
jgi:2-polyprenyl-3-methyl-5-hydroxy-6-metoxy-1,4-benzoquinol methylase